MWQEMFYNTCKVRPPHMTQYTEWENRYLPLHTYVSSSKISIRGLLTSTCSSLVKEKGCDERQSLVLQGHFLFYQKFGKFWNGHKLYGNFMRKFPENLEMVEFLKSKLFIWKFQKVWEEINWKQNFCLPHKIVLFSGKFEMADAFTTRNFWKFKPDFSSNGKCPRMPVWVSLDQSSLHVKTKLIEYIGFICFYVDTLTSLEANLQNGMIVHLFVKNMEDFAKINAVYKTFLRVNPPAR